VVIQVNRNGALVQRVLPAEAGDQMGLVPGDAIVRVNGRAVTSMAGYQRLLATCGGDARVTVWKPDLGRYESWQVSWDVLDPDQPGIGAGGFPPRGPSVRRSR